MNNKQCPKAIRDNVYEHDHLSADLFEGGLRLPEDLFPARVIRMVDHNEYKRRQAPPSVKITHRAFGKDRRMPITNRFDCS